VKNNIQRGSTPSLVKSSPSGLTILNIKQMKKKQTKKQITPNFIKIDDICYPIKKFTAREFKSICRIWVEEINKDDN
jgi:hypothetical protein